MVARIDALLRQAGSQSPSTVVIEVGQLKLDTANKTISLGELNPQLTEAEYDILLLLASNPGSITLPARHRL
ncbi:hypothetical protein KT99_04084 [Shewanella benthica KT99]|uniref:OmpR/PhoB-type domain-containing protein n=1 Tax=Shewanella benthica KT99 TaxID=314608 RepID=A9D222_9GAMM|nr:hypothetical protein KT99_04084 [Shewanella benthica KT99]